MRVLIGWAGAAVILAGALAGGVIAANATVFSASGFVRDYLDALRSGRVDEVRGLPGVDAAGLDPRLLDARAFEGVDAEIVADEERDGVHRVRVAASRGGMRGEAVLEVERIGTRFGLFPEWGFASSPVTAVRVSTTGDARFTVGGVPLEAPQGGPVVFAALSPALYTFTHDSQFLEAEPVTLLATEADAAVALDIRPSAAFETAVRDAVERDLARCTEQPVLFPSGCAFGHAIANRVASEPRWSITDPPDAELAASETFGLWEVPASTGVALLTVDVQSLFDGSVSTLEQHVSFTAEYRVAFDGTAVVVEPVLE